MPRLNKTYKQDYVVALFPIYPKSGYPTLVVQSNVGSNWTKYRAKKEATFTLNNYAYGVNSSMPTYARETHRAKVITRRMAKRLELL